MLDINLLRKDLPSAIARLDTRKRPQAFLNVEAFQSLEAERKTCQMRTEELQNQRNNLSKQIGQLKAKGEDASAVMAQVSASKTELESMATRLDQIPHLVMHIGDISYADGEQHHWDLFMRKIEPIASAVPYMTCRGNHVRPHPPFTFPLPPPLRAACR